MCIRDRARSTIMCDLVATREVVSLNSAIIKTNQDDIGAGLWRHVFVFIAGSNFVWVWFIKTIEDVSCECDRLNDWNSNLQDVWFVRHARWGVLILYIIYNLVFVSRINDTVDNTQFHKFYARPFARVLHVYPNEGNRSVTRVDATGVNRRRK